jgi:hypothetical protein
MMNKTGGQKSDAAGAESTVSAIKNNTKKISSAFSKYLDGF